jgi:RNA polymerase sigma-70 factor (ECF subfamily)
VDGDTILVTRLMAGDEEALGEVVDALGPYILAVASRVLGDRSAAEDVVQDVLIALWQRPDRFDPERGSLRSWLGMQANRRAIDLLRQELRRSGREQRSARLTAIPGQASKDEMEEALVRSAVSDAVLCLPEEQRQVVELAYYRGLSYREVACALKIPEGTAKSRLRLALGKLEAVLDRQLLETT